MVWRLRLAFGVISVGGEAETETGGVTFAAAGVELDESSGASEKKYEDASG